MRAFRWLIVVIAVLALAPAALADGPVVYVVQSGDTLSGLAQRFQTTSDAIARLNNIDDPSQLQVGQKITISSIGPSETGAADKTDTPKLGPRRDTSPQRVHVVAPGETLSGIATANNTTIDELTALNSLTSRDVLSVGQQLLLPDAPSEAKPALPVGRLVKYTVQPDDTLVSIGFRYGIDPRLIAAVNSDQGAFWPWTGGDISIPANWRVPDAPAPALSKRILVSIKEQHVWAWEGDHLVFSFVASTGIATHPTRPGTYAIKTKLPMARSTGLNLDMPSWLGIYDAGTTENGFHGLPVNLANGNKLWGGFIGSPISYGCVVMRDADAAALYDWADIGTPVEIKS
ncbi:MAG: LysM peptidoglycan-binding domain-containing protein [Anaerolineae bacterium]